MLNYYAKFSSAISKYPKVARVFSQKVTVKNIKFPLHRQSERARMCL